MAAKLILPSLKTRKFTVGGQEYEVAFDFNAIAAAENVTKLNILTGVFNIGEANATQIRGLLYASLLPAGKYSLEDAGNIIQLAFVDDNYFDIIGAILGSLADMRPKPESSDEITQAPDPNAQTAPI